MLGNGPWRSGNLQVLVLLWLDLNRRRTRRSIFMEVDYSENAWTTSMLLIWVPCDGVASMTDEAVDPFQEWTKYFHLYSLNENLDCPIGRSWHSFTAVSKSTAILYGGLTSDGDALDDCWMYNSMNNSWLRIDLKVSEKRVWHQGVHIDNELIIVGGVKNNMGRVAAVSLVDLFSFTDKNHYISTSMQQLLII